jgi:hypothetical protein
MYVTNLRITDYQAAKVVSYRVEINGHWITVSDSAEQVVYRRNPDMDTWHDETHAAIGKAISALEDAILAGIRSDNV